MKLPISFHKEGCRFCCLMCGRGGDISRQGCHILTTALPDTVALFQEGELHNWMSSLGHFFSPSKWWPSPILSSFTLGFCDGALSDSPLLLLLEVTAQLLCERGQINSYVRASSHIPVPMFFTEKNKVFLGRMSPLWCYFPSYLQGLFFISPLFWGMFLTDISLCPRDLLQLQ